MVQYNLLKNSISAYFAAIELHNKPNIAYRYETVTLLIMNAWELALKAFIRKYIKDKSIFEKEDMVQKKEPTPNPSQEGNPETSRQKEKHTISFDIAIKYVDDYINGEIKPKSFLATKENLGLIKYYRNNVAHFYNEALEPDIFMLVARAALNFVEFIKLFFKKDIIADEGLFIMPLGFKLPFKPEDFLSKNSVNYISSVESKRFIDKIIKVVCDLKEAGIEESVVLGFNIYLDSVKKITNSDLLVAITSEEEADASFAKTDKIQISDDPNARPVYLSDEELFKRYPLCYRSSKDKCNSLTDRCKERYTDFLLNNTFHDLIVRIRDNQIYACGRPPHPARKSKNVSYIYSERIFEFFDEHYTKRSEENQGKPGETRDRTTILKPNNY